MRRIFLLLYIFLAAALWPCLSEAMERTGRLFSNRIAVAGDYTSFCQDREGFIWIGTKRGLLRFDGNSYDLYRHDDADPGSLSDSRIISLLCDSRGRLWVATESGLNLYNSDEDDFQMIDIPSENFNGYIIGISEQVDGTVTFIVSGVGLYIVSDTGTDKTPVAVKYMSKSVEREYNTLLCASNGRIYLGTHDGRIFSLAQNGALSLLKEADGEYIMDFSQEEDGNVLVCTGSDTYRIDRHSNALTKLQASRPMAITNMSNSYHGKVYITTYGDGLYSVKAKSDMVEDVKDIYCPFINLNSAKIGDAYTAPDGNLWLGCNYQGIVMVPGKNIQFTYRKLTDAFPDFTGGMPAMGIWQGNVVACLDRGRVGIFSPDGRLVKSIVVPDNGKITHIEVVNPTEVLLSMTDSGVWRMNPVTGTVSKLVDIPGKYPSIMTVQGKDGEIFIGVHGSGLMRYDLRTGQRRWIPYDWNSGRFTNPYINCLNRTDDGKIWIGLYGGLACFDLNKEEMIEIDQTPFLNGAAFSIVPCLTDNSVWIGTSQGLVHFDPGKGVLDKLTTANGLCDNDIRSITRDNIGGKWIATKRGLSYIPTDNDTILSYYGGNGFVETSFNHIGYSDSARRIFVGSDNGITSFVPDSVPAPGFDSEVRISGFFINGERVAPHGKHGKCRIEMPDGDGPIRLYLPYNNNAMSFRLSTMDYRDASNVRLMWRLGKKEEWIMGAPGVSTIILPRLDPGRYDLEICAMENNVKSPVKWIRIEISNPWYWTPLARIIYAVILLSLLILALIVYRKKKEEEVNEDKIKFFMDISHDIRSPMTLVMSPLESLMKKEDFTPDVKDTFNVMHRNAQRVMSLVNQLLDIRKLDKGKMRLSCRKTDVADFVNELVELFVPQAAEKEQDLRFECVDDPGVVWLDRDNFDKIMVNLISNAIKYTPKGGDIVVSLSVVDDPLLSRSMQVKVTDTGIGIDAKTQAKLFEPFYRVREDHAPATMGFGIGLDLCRRLVALHHGSISGENRTDGEKGSVFTVTIPLDEARYAEGELTDSAEGEKRNGEHLIMGNTPASGSLTPKTRPLTAGGKVLVVDDDAELRQYIMSIVSRYYKVKEAANGAEALKLVAEWQPDIVISDVVMPEMDGLTLLKRLKANAETLHIPVILLSSKNALADRMAGWDKGADGYLGKPFSADELESMVDNLIENRQRMKGKFSGAQQTEGKIDAVEVKGNDEVLMERINKKINEYIDVPEFNVEKLAAEVGVSRAQLHRKMKELIGMTPSDYIRNIRIQRACELLKQGDIEVTQVAYKIGFASQPHFSAHFKRYTGYSPTEYRDKILSERDV